MAGAVEFLRVANRPERGIHEKGYPSDCHRGLAIRNLANQKLG
jgi:hypothetical protein